MNRCQVQEGVTKIDPLGPGAQLFPTAPLGQLMLPCELSCDRHNSDNVKRGTRLGLKGFHPQPLTLIGVSCRWRVEAAFTRRTRIAEYDVIAAGIVWGPDDGRVQQPRSANKSNFRRG